MKNSRILASTFLFASLAIAAPAPSPDDAPESRPGVFDPGYRLAPLVEVEAYAKANKHLPNAPTSDDFDDKGLDQAQTNRALLQKIEELTLHVIRLEKRIQTCEEKR
jgi:hypothetical protein